MRYYKQLCNKCLKPLAYKKCVTVKTATSHIVTVHKSCACRYGRIKNGCSYFTDSMIELCTMDGKPCDI